MNATVYCIDTFDGNLFVGIAGGVFLSTDSGANWINTGSGLTSIYGTQIHALIVSSTNLFAGTDDDSAFRCSLSEILGSSAVTNVPSTSLLITSYPNPSTSSVSISFSCSESSVGEVSIFNMLGAEVARLYVGEFAAGEHSFTWDAGGATAGMYECVVHMNGNVQRVPLAHLR